MKKITKLLAIILASTLIFTALPLSFATSEKDVEAIVNEDYNNYINTNGNNNDNLVAGEDYADGEILFNFIGSSSNRSSQLQSLSSSFGLTILEKIDETSLKSNVRTSSSGYDAQTLYRASFNSSEISVFEMCKAMNRLDNIKDCEPNYYYSSCEIQSSTSFTMPTEISSSSSYASNQKWYFDNMNITETWEKYDTLGEGETVCVIDNGLNFEHNEIKNQLWDDGNGNHGYNAEENNNNIFGTLDGGPCHGSHCAGIIGMEANNGGLVGVAPGAKIMMCNAVISATGYFSNANLIKSLEYATEHGADIISMSLGGYNFGINFQRALTCASESALILCAAGNDGLNTTTRLHFPSASSAVIGVMALGSGTSTNTLSSYSNYDLTGRYYEVAAPGTSIYAIDANSNTGYVGMTGTSMATPFMAGVCALYASKHKNMTPVELRRSIKEAPGELVLGYKADAKTASFKKATPLTLLSYACAAPTNVNISDETLDKAVRTALNVSDSYQLTNYDLEGVTSLDLSGTDFNNYSALSELPYLCYLNFSNTGLTDESAKEIFDNISNQVFYIDFSNNKLTNTDFLKNYDGFLSKVILANNKITDISGLSEFTTVSDLDISYNQIKDISPVKNMTGIMYFYAPGNLIEDPTPVLGLSYLEEIYFGNYNPNLADVFAENYFESGNGGNRISTLAPFTAIKKTSRIHYLNLSYNFVTNDPEYNIHASEIDSILAYVGASKYSNTANNLTQITYKFVTSPNAEGKIIDATDYTVSDLTVPRSDNSFTLSSTFTPENANHYNYLTWTSDSEILKNSSGEISFNSLDIDSSKTFLVSAFPCALSTMESKSIYITITAPEIYSAIKDNENLIIKTNTATKKIMLGEDEITVGFKDNGDIRTWTVKSDYAGSIKAGDRCGYSDSACILVGTDNLSSRAKIISAEQAQSGNVTLGDTVTLNVASSISTEKIIIRDSNANEIPCKAILKSTSSESKNWSVSFKYTDDSTANATINVLASKNDEISTAEVYTKSITFGVTIPLSDISFNNDTNSATIYLNNGTYQIKYSPVPASANSQNTITFASKNTTIATVTSKGYIYPKKEGSTTITMTLKNGTVRSFFINVKQTFCESASVFNPSSSYTATKTYNAIVYTKTTSSLKLTDQNGNLLGTFASADYSTKLTDQNGNSFQRWIVPFTINEAGDYTIHAYAYDSSASSYTATAGLFTITVDALTGSDAYGTIKSYNNKFDTKISLYSTGNLVQTVTIQGLSSETSLATTTDYRFTNVPNGTYTVKVEKEGCVTYSIIEVKVNGDTEIKESNAGGTNWYSLDKCAGDINGDNVINISDISVALLDTNYSKTTNQSQDTLCDINGDNVISINDIAIILANCN